nr:reverse transcriptase domain-containing protein [Tanacetum cinerariifolium]
ATTSLTGFSGETIWPLGQLRLLLIIGDANHSTRAWMNFMIVRSLSPYNGIIERPGIRPIQAVPSTVHGMLKFPIDGGIEVVIGGTLSDKGRIELCSILKKNLDIFAWQPSDMTGVTRGPKTGGGRDHERGLLPRLAIQSGHEVYVDDLVVKSYTEAEMLRDIEETFRRTAAKMKYHARRAQYYVQAKNVGQRTDLRYFLIEMPDENPQATPVEKLNKSCRHFSRMVRHV